MSEDAGLSGCATIPEPAFYIDLNGDALPDLVKPMDFNSLAGVYTLAWYYHKTRVKGAYPYALLPREVIHVAPILAQPAPGEALPKRPLANARVTRRVNEYETRWIHQGKTYAVHP